MAPVIMSKIFILPNSNPYKANFADNSWENIIMACQSNEVPDTWAVGDSKPMTVNGTDYLIDIIGKNHDVYSDGSGTAPLTFQFHDCYGIKYAMNSSAASWADCAMRNTHLPEVKSKMPVCVQNAIKNVNKLTSPGKGAGDSFIINTVSDGLFLLADDEIDGSTLASNPDEGAQYEYYSYDYPNRTIKTLSGTASAWFTRSLQLASTLGAFYMVSYNGGISIGAVPSASLGVAPAFCF